MTITVLLFAAIKDHVGEPRVSLEINEVATVSAIRSQLMEAYPRISELILRSAMAFDNEFLPDDRIISPGSEIACIPPVSGG